MHPKLLITALLHLWAIDIVLAKDEPHNKPPVGTVLTLQAKEQNFCNQFRKSELQSGNVNAVLPIDAEAISYQKNTPYEYAGFYGHYVFDINNDGRDEVVVGMHAATHARDADIYFVYSDGKVPEPVVGHGEESHSERVYAKYATTIIPFAWSGLRDQALFAEQFPDDQTYQVNIVNPPSWMHGNEANFRFRYLHLLPFRYKQVNYFLTSSLDVSERHWYTVLRTNPDYSVTEMCVFHVVKKRY